mgnify:CR=1 FL=1
MQVFLAEKPLLGCNGLVVTDAMRIAIAAQACLLLLNRKTDTSLTVGRDLSNALVLDDATVSASHLTLSSQGGGWSLVALDSKNGTTVNNAPVQEWQLADGDVIRLGHSEIVVRVH